MINLLVSKISRKKMNSLIAEQETDQSALEIGAKGNPSYAKYFPNRVGIDIEPGAGVDIIASVYKLPFSDNKFDVVLCVSVLEHLESPRKAILEIRRVLKTGGKIIVSVPFLFPIHDAPGDYWRFTKFGLRELFSDGWQINKLCAETNSQETFAILLQRFGYQTKAKANTLTKFLIFALAKVIEKMPNLINKTYGDIHKNIEEPEAFASAYFLVAVKK